jgi:hypothetical protein
MLSGPLGNDRQRLARVAGEVKLVAAAVIDEGQVVGR